MRFDNFKHDITLRSLFDIINRRVEISSESVAYIEWAEKFFNDITKSLEGILETKEEGGYYFVEPSIIKIITNYGETSRGISQMDIENLRKDFIYASGSLKNLKENPLDFYKSDEAEKTLNIISKLMKKNYD